MAPAAETSLKDQGNAHFRAGEYEHACAAYTAALKEEPDAALYSNRSAARLKLGQAAAALADAQEAVRLRPSWDKAHFRQGCALEELGQLQDALDAFNEGKELNPANKELSDRAREVGKRLKAEAKTAAERRGFDPVAGLAELGLGPRSSAAGARPAAAVAAAEAAAADPVGAHDAWTKGLSVERRYEWFSDCYRMRVDDEYVMTGEAVGRYNPEATGEDVVTHFLLFCKLAVRHGVVPSAGWDWAAFLKVAVGLLPYAFEKSDAKKKWGGENVFASLGGGRSLRATGLAVMGGFDTGGYDPAVDAAVEEQNDMWDEVEPLVMYQLRDGTPDGTMEAAFANVGGVAAWRELLQALPLPSLRDVEDDW